MSGLLESVLDPTRRADCAYHDEKDRMADHYQFGTPLYSYRGPDASTLNGPEPAEPDPLEWQQARALGDVDSFVNWLDVPKGDLSDNADRALRLPHRTSEADTQTLFAAALLSAHREDAEATLTCMAELVARYLTRK
jgi:hypothetical protein